MAEEMPGDVLFKVDVLLRLPDDEGVFGKIVSFMWV